MALKPHTNNLKTSNFSKLHLLVFVLAFGLIGIIIWRSLAAPNPNLVGDLDNSNTVDITDLSILLTHFGTNYPDADIDNSGLVDITDLSMLLSHFGGSYSGTAIKIGETSVLSTDDNGNANMLLAQSASLAQSGTVQSLSFYVNNPAGKLRLGIYDSTGPSSGPGTKLTETAEITPVSGWNTASVTTPVSLTAGTYWLAYLPSDNNLSFKKTADSSSSGRYYSYTYGTLPSAFSTAPSTTTSHWSFYATLNTTGTPPTPPATGKLKWAPPALNNPTTIYVSNTNNFPALDNTKDYIIKMPSTPLTVRGGLILKGGHNVVVIGGEIRQDTLLEPGSTNTDKQYGIYSINQTGTLHIEGMWIHGNGLGQGLVLAQDSGAIVQMQNTRIETLHPIAYGSTTIGEVHTDSIQSWSGPKVLHLYNDTLVSRGYAMQFDPFHYQVQQMGQWDFEQVNTTQTITQPAEAGVLNRSASMGGAWWPEAHKSIWIKPNPNDPTVYFVNWSSNKAGWNPGGGTNITGENINEGTPASGDFVPASTVGIGYVSPG